MSRSLNVFSLLVVVGLSMHGCIHEAVADKEYNVDERIDRNEITDISSTGVPTIFFKAEEKEKNYSIRKEVVEKHTEKSILSVQYPCLISDDRDLCGVNELIKGIVDDSIQVYFDESGDEKYDECFLELDYAITYANEQFISIIITGMAYVKPSAHPTQILFTINIDLEDVSRILLRDVYEIDNEFLNVYKEAFRSEEPERSKILDNYEYGDDFLLDDLMQSDSLFVAVQTYFTDDSLGISLPVAFVIGGHVEIEIPYEEITQFLR